MRAFVLQDWLTIRGASTVTSVVMNEVQYAQLDAFQDAIFWLQVSEVTTGAGAITLNYETAPLKDDSLFASMATAAITTTAMTPPTISKVLLFQNPTVPLSRWVRWRLVQSGATAAWDVTFRVLLVANQIFAFHPTQAARPGGAPGGAWRAQ
jgi:hypothetical protein